VVSPCHSHIGVQGSYCCRETFFVCCSATPTWTSVPWFHAEAPASGSRAVSNDTMTFSHLPERPPGADICVYFAGLGPQDAPANVTSTFARALRKQGSRKCCSGHAKLAAPWTARLAITRPGEDTLEVLQWARANNCPWSEFTCAYAAGNGHLHVLAWAHANGCDWSESTSARAAIGGHLEVLQWAALE
jgi:hypothetical protein